MNEINRFSDEELVAYLDGEYQFCSAERIAYAIKSDPNLAKRLALLETDTVIIREAFDQLIRPDAIKALDIGNATNNVKQI